MSAPNVFAFDEPTHTMTVVLRGKDAPDRPLSSIEALDLVASLIARHRARLTGEAAPAQQEQQDPHAQIRDDAARRMGELNRELRGSLANAAAMRAER